MHDQPSTVAVHTGEPEVQGASSVRTAGIHSLHAARARARGELAARCVYGKGSAVSEALLNSKGDAFTCKLSLTGCFFHLYFLAMSWEAKWSPLALPHLLSPLCIHHLKHLIAPGRASNSPSISFKGALHNSTLTVLLKQIY